MFGSLANNSSNYSNLNLKRRIEMDEPVILTGGTDLPTVEIVLPRSFKTKDIAEGMFSVPLKPGTAPTVIVITDIATGKETTHSIEPSTWKIEIK
jgi:hypothetical protein